MKAPLHVVLCALTILWLANRSAGLKMHDAQFAEESVLPEYSRIPAKVNDNLVRFVFFAGLGGTGHHGWQNVMRSEKLCERHVEAEMHLRDLWYGDDGKADLYYTQLTNAFSSTVQRTPKNHAKLYCLNILAGSMLSYPDCNSKRHHPDLVSLTRAAAEAAVDLRIVVMHRDPAPMLVSLSFHRGFMDAPMETQQMGNQAAILSAQLQSIDSKFYMCTPFTGVHGRAEMLAQWLVGGLHDTAIGNLSRGIREHYRDTVDDVEGAQFEIKQKAPYVQVKLDTWQAFHGLILRACES